MLAGKGGGAELEVVEEITGFTAYCFEEAGSKEGTVVGKLAIVNFHHEQWMG